MSIQPIRHRHRRQLYLPLLPAPPTNDPAASLGLVESVPNPPCILHMAARCCVGGGVGRMAVPISPLVAGEGGEGDGAAVVFVGGVGLVLLLDAKVLHDASVLLREESNLFFQSFYVCLNLHLLRLECELTACMSLDEVSDHLVHVLLVEHRRRKRTHGQLELLDANVVLDLYDACLRVVVSAENVSRQRSVVIDLCGFDDQVIVTRPNSTVLAHQRGRSVSRYDVEELERHAPPGRDPFFLHLARNRQTQLCGVVESVNGDVDG
mmetsp:Transcript_47867/g.112542  ORF Transcript_47867/g.112542 Transcript_47867/m.112542 type:complete len:265 (-) Transcript_47867:484-1278(-)